MDEYLGHRVIQAWQLSHFIAATKMGELSLLLGDLNASPYTLEYQLVTLFSDLIDCHNMNDGDGFTSAARDNVYSNSAEYPERIDYIFHKVRVKPIKHGESQVWICALESSISRLLSWKFPALRKRINKQIKIQINK